MYARIKTDLETLHKHLRKMYGTIKKKIFKEKKPSMDQYCLKPAQKICFDNIFILFCLHPAALIIDVLTNTIVI